MPSSLWSLASSDLDSHEQDIIKPIIEDRFSRTFLLYELTCYNGPIKVAFLDIDDHFWPQVLEGHTAVSYLDIIYNHCFRGTQTQTTTVI
jgi:hypothetical protein